VRHGGWIIVLALLLCSAVPGAAQTKGRLSVGGAVTAVNTTDDDVGSLVGWGPLVRLNPKKGWGPAGGFSWFRADVENPSGGGPLAKLKVRPWMGGVAYTIGNQPTLVSFSVVTGPSFNGLDFDEDFVRNQPGGAVGTLEAKNSWAVRPGVGLTWTVAPRVAIIGFGGYTINRPDIVYRDLNGQEFRNQWKADAVLLSIGAVYSLF
jgi:hypothetical protein